MLLKGRSKIRLLFRRLEKRARDDGFRLSVEDTLKIPGGILVRFPTAEGGFGHLGISVGDGERFIEVNSRQGVFENSARGRKWDIGAVISRLDYSIDQLLLAQLIYAEAGGAGVPAMQA